MLFGSYKVDELMVLIQLIDWSMLTNREPKFASTFMSEAVTGFRHKSSQRLRQRAARPQLIFLAFPNTNTAVQTQFATFPNLCSHWL